MNIGYTPSLAIYRIPFLTCTILPIAIKVLLMILLGEMRIDCYSSYDNHGSWECGLTAGVATLVPPSVSTESPGTTHCTTLTHRPSLLSLCPTPEKCG